MPGNDLKLADSKQSEQKTEKSVVLVFLPTFDNSVCNDEYKRRYKARVESKELPSDILRETNQRLIDHMRTQVTQCEDAKEVIKQVILGNGDQRQTEHEDRENAQYGSWFAILVAIRNLLVNGTAIAAHVNTSNILGGVFNSNLTGATFLKTNVKIDHEARQVASKSIPSEQFEYCPDSKAALFEKQMKDPKLVALLYRWAHMVSLQHPNSTVRLCFYSPNKDVLRYLDCLAMLTRGVFPYNIEINLFYYDGTAIPSSSITISRNLFFTEQRELRKVRFDSDTRANRNYNDYLKNLYLALQNHSNLDTLTYLAFLTKIDELKKRCEVKAESKVSQGIDGFSELKKIAKLFINQIPVTNVSPKELEYFHKMIGLMSTGVANKDGTIWRSTTDEWKSYHQDTIDELAKLLETHSVHAKYKSIAKIFLGTLIFLVGTCVFSALFSQIALYPQDTWFAIYCVSSYVVAVLSGVGTLYEVDELKNIIVPPPAIYQTGMEFFQKLKMIPESKEQKDAPGDVMVARFEQGADSSLEVSVTPVSSSVVLSQ